MPQKYPFLLELITRLKLKSPSFFAKLQAILFTLAGILEFCTLLKDVVGVNFPDIMEQYLNHGSVFIATFMGGIAALPVDDKEHLEAKLDEKVSDKK